MVVPWCFASTHPQLGATPFSHLYFLIVEQRMKVRSLDTTNQDKPKPPTPTLFALWKQYDPDGSLLHTLANMANVSKSIVEKIFLHEPVTRVRSEERRVGKEWQSRGAGD